MAIQKVMFHINSLGKGGAERVVVTLAKQFAGRGILVSIATEWAAEDEYALPEQVSRIHVGLKDEEDTLSGKAKRKIRKDRLHECLKKENPDVLYTFCRNANYRGILAAKGTGVPVIASVRSDPNVDYASFIQKTIASFLYQKAAGMVFQTEDARDYFPKSIQKKSKIILNPLNEKYQVKETVTTRRKAVVAVGRFHEAKDHLTLIKAFEILLKKYPDYVLELYGDASEDNTYYMVKEHVKNHKLEERIQFMGNSNHLENRIADAAMFVMSSKYEGMPNALMEAMALELPVISTDCPCGGPRTLIEDGVNGLLVNVGDEEQMATAMEKYLENPMKANQLGQCAGKIKACASADKIAGEWLAYAESVI